MERRMGIGVYLVATFLLAWVAAWISWGSDFVIMDAVNLWFFGLVADIIAILGVFFFLKKNPILGSIFIAGVVGWMWWAYTISTTDFMNALFLYIILGVIAFGLMQKDSMLIEE